MLEGLPMKLLSLCPLVFAAAFAFAPLARAQDAKSTLIVAGPRTPELLELEYPATEAVHEARKNIYERLLGYAMKTNPDGIQIEDFDHLVGALAESWEVSPDRTSITFHLAKAKAFNGDELTADDVMWTFKRGWEIKGTFYWYMHQMLKIDDFDKAFSKIDDHTVKVTLPGTSPLIERLWVNNDLGIIDATEAKKHVTSADPQAQTWLSTHTASFAPYQVDSVYAGPRGRLRGQSQLLSGRAQTEEDPVPRNARLRQSRGRAAGGLNRRRRMAAPARAEPPQDRAGRKSVDRLWQLHPPRRHQQRGRLPSPTSASARR